MWVGVKEFEMCEREAFQIKIKKVQLQNFLNFNLITSVKVLGYSDKLPESIKYTINTLRSCED